MIGSRAGDRHSLRAGTTRLGLTPQVTIVEEPRQSDESHDIRSQDLGGSVVASRGSVLARSPRSIIVLHGSFIARAAYSGEIIDRGPIPQPKQPRKSKGDP